MQVYNNLDEAFKYLLDNYIMAKTEPLKNHTMIQHVTQDLTTKLKENAELNNENYLVKGSVGIGRWAEIPWVSVFLKSIAIKATKGYYVVYLVPKDMSGIYVSLNQGWTYFKEKYGAKQGAIKIKKVASLIRERLHTTPDQLTLSSIDLKGTGPLSRGYENGHIVGRFYPREAFPNSEEIIQDLHNLLVVYKEIEALISGRSIDQFNDYLLMNSDGKFIEDENESLYQEMIRRNTILDKEDDGDSVLEPVPRPEAIVDKGGRLSWPRNASIAAEAILRADYQCEYNPSLPVFTSKITGQSFMEAHHLVPMSLQEVFDVSLDRVDNIICLCPHVHRLIHHAVDYEREEVLEKLFKKRSEKLKKVGIHISLYDLKKAYLIKTNNL